MSMADKSPATTNRRMNAMKSKYVRGTAVFLRRPGDDNTVFNWVSSDEKKHVEYRLMGKAYFNAAKVLVRKWSRSTALTDFDAYPIIFLYRHALELLIKSVVVAGRTRLAIRDGGIEKALRGHSLTKLWPIATSIFDRMGWAKNTSEGASLHKKGKMVQELDSVDPLSMSFRYPRDKGGSDLLPRHFTFNVPQSAKLINSLCADLLGAAVAIDHLPLGGD
jgi:hypothetical protein